MKFRNEIRAFYQALTEQTRIKVVLFPMTEYSNIQSKIRNHEELSPTTAINLFETDVSYSGPSNDKFKYVLNSWNDAISKLINNKEK